jgi:hypothetical protein
VARKYVAVFMNRLAKPAEIQPKAQDPVKVDPKHYKVEAENKQVRVLRSTYGPGEKSVMHGHPACVGLPGLPSR